MAHFAELFPENEVLRVLVLDNEILLDEGGIEHEGRGIDYLIWLLGGTWIQTSYNASIRGRYAAPGMLYHSDLDLFVEPQPYASWTLDAAGEWQPLAPRPDGEGWHWIEAELAWHLNINQADATALDLLDGVGEALASEIIAERNAGGPFTNIQDVAVRVTGIGPSTVDGWSNAFAESA